MGRSAVVITLLVLVCLGQALWIVLQSRRQVWQESALDTPIARGRAVAERAGCFACHGPGGTSPSPNPGAKYGEVPSWGGGSWMIWNNRESDVRAWIVDGHPPDRAPDDGALIPMPPYDGVLSNGEIDDVVAYVLAVSRFGTIADTQAREGRGVALRMGCFGCHGPEGRGGVWNPGSFAGYIPPWDGAEYAELVRSDDEFREWVQDGVSRRLAGNLTARGFLDKAAIQMPAYRGELSDEQIEQLLAYVKWVQANPRTGRR